MNQTDFEKLMESVRQADRIIAGAEEPSRVTEVPALRVKQLRAKLGLTQSQFAALVHVEVATIRNWEQGRRQPEGPALALLTALENDPEHVIAALNM
jgi:putative transcriptional regulator